MTPVIERVDTYSLNVPLRREIADSLYVRTHWTIPVVEIRTNDGLVGGRHSHESVQLFRYLDATTRAAL